MANHTVLFELYVENMPSVDVLKAPLMLTEKVSTVFNDISVGQIDTYATSNRLLVIMQKVSEKTMKTTREIRGPKVSAKDWAIDGFCQKYQISTKELIQKETTKGLNYFYLQKISAACLQDVLKDRIGYFIQSFKFSEKMRWGQGNFEFIRPIHNLILMVDDKHLDIDIMLDEYKRLFCTNFTLIENKPVYVSHADRYVSFLQQHNIWVDQKERENSIRQQLHKVPDGITPVISERFLSLIAAKVENPLVIKGKIDEKYLILPLENVSLILNQDEYCFSYKTKDGQLHNTFGFVANGKPTLNIKKASKMITQVVWARLEDSIFFVKQDLMKPLINNVPKLQRMFFFKDVVSMYAHTEHMAKLLMLMEIPLEIATLLCQLSKCDLVTRLVFEIPEMQGIAGAYYAERQGVDLAIVQAIREQYKPIGPSDTLPKKNLGQKLALSDKLSTLATLFSADIRPTGSKDPYALRRATLGCLRILWDNDTLAEKGYIYWVRKAMKIQNVSHTATHALIDFFNERIKIYLKTLYPSLLVEAILTDNIKTKDKYILKHLMHMPHKDLNNLLYIYRRFISFENTSVDSTYRPLSNKKDKYFEKFLINFLNQGGLTPLTKKAPLSLDFLQRIETFKTHVMQWVDSVKILDDNPHVRNERIHLINRTLYMFHNVASFKELGGYTAAEITQNFN